MLSSPMIMSLSAVFVIVGTGLIIIAGLTDNWMEYRVDRRALSSNRETVEKLGDSFINNPIYFSRNVGLYNLCFPSNVPTGIGSTTKFSQACIENPDLFPKDAVYNAYTDTQTHRFYFLRVLLISFGVGAALLVVSMMFGMAGCYTRKAKYSNITACFVLLAILCISVSIVLFHLVYYYESDILKMPPFQPSWDTSLRQSTIISFGWSYYLCFVGIVFLVLAAAMFFLSSCAIRREQEAAFDNKHQAYLQYMNTDKQQQMLPYTYGSPYSGGIGTYYPSSYYTQYPTSNFYGYMTYGH